MRLLEELPAVLETRTCPVLREQTERPEHRAHFGTCGLLPTERFTNPPSGQPGGPPEDEETHRKCGREHELLPIPDACVPFERNHGGSGRQSDRQTREPVEAQRGGDAHHRDAENRDSHHSGFETTEKAGDRSEDEAQRDPGMNLSPAPSHQSAPAHRAHPDSI